MPHICEIAERNLLSVKIQNHKLELKQFFFSISFNISPSFYILNSNFHHGIIILLKTEP